jgi:glycosyltransferase involved in cell wall biosynthesis
VSLLHALNLVSGVLLGAVWLYHGVAAQRGMRQIADLTQPGVLDVEARPEELPRVSVIVPARNEEGMIEASVDSLLALDYPDYELIVIDDRSEDATGEILDRIESEVNHRRATGVGSAPNLRVIHVRELPPGWLGKTHAMWRAAQAATGRWLLFSDADVVHDPRSLRLAVAYAEQNKAAHMVLLPTMVMHTVGERMMISFFQAMFLFQHRPWKVGDPRAKDILGVGAFNLVRRDAYEAIGGYESMRLSVVDDMRLAQKLKQAGWGSCVAFGPQMVRVRWAVGARGVIRNLTKNFFAHLQFNLPFAVVAVLGMLWLHLGPWLGIFFAAGWAQAGYAVGMAVLAAVYLAMGRRTGISPVYLLLHPLATLLMVYTLLRSTALTLARGGVEWRGTFYPLSELKKNS